MSLNRVTVYSSFSTQITQVKGQMMIMNEIAETQIHRLHKFVSDIV